MTKRGTLSPNFTCNLQHLGVSPVIERLTGRLVLHPTCIPTESLSVVLHLWTTPHFAFEMQPVRLGVEGQAGEEMNKWAKGGLFLAGVLCGGFVEWHVLHQPSIGGPAARLRAGAGRAQP